ncbi:hypothetical protein BD410DRAFT_778730 [Rickenella mellea]|uniref:BTB domain-containing protein n=1 Tax=Rickenella mellea TaxID=50990 RepID=A0A4Y7PHA1_9AGAM|nr:hypothetical protein BD410DRAFT_778730 [Rickenella mellea]
MASAETEIRHEALYFPDGDIVISAKNDNANKIFFRVHKFILSHHSPVFKDMFSLPAPQDNLRQSYDGVSQVLEMSDRPDDLASLFRVLYDPATLPYKRYNPDTPLVCKGILKLATKYQMDTLRNRIIEQIISDWPKTLYEWDAIESHNAFFEKAPDSLKEQIIQSEPAAAIEIARLFDIPSILPAAFLQLTRTKIQNRWSARPKDPKDRMCHYARWELLGAEDSLRIVEITRSIHITVLCFQTFDLHKSTGCSNVSYCETRLQWEFNIFSSHYPLSLDILADVACLSSYISKNCKLCKSCDENISKRLKQLRHNIWNESLCIANAEPWAACCYLSLLDLI